MPNPLFKHLPAKVIAALGLTVVLGVPLGAYSTPVASAEPSQSVVKPGEVPKFRFHSDDVQRTASVPGRHPSQFDEPVSRPEVAQAVIGRPTPGDFVEVYFTVMTPPGCYQKGWKLAKVWKGGWEWDTSGPLDTQGLKDGPEEYKKFAQEVLDKTMNSWTCLELK